MARRFALLLSLFIAFAALFVACRATVPPDRQATELAEREGLEAPPLKIDEEPTSMPEPVVRFANGKLKILRQYKVGDEGLYVLNGAYTEYYASGRMKLEGFFVDGKRHGVFSTYYPNGIKATQRQFVSGVEHGRYVAWDENGYKYWEVQYVQGKPHGPYSSYYPSGQKRGEGNCIFGRQHGQHRVYDKQGNLVRVTRYVHGEKQQ
jgi:antitoxin component YwqK of YwqJK toxin-antitoxin module